MKRNAAACQYNMSGHGKLEVLLAVTLLNVLLLTAHAGNWKLMLFLISVSAEAEGFRSVQKHDEDHTTGTRRWGPNIPEGLGEK